MSSSAKENVSATKVKRLIDLTDYTSVLPYASQMFGVYQPLLGWKSKRIEERFEKGYQNDRAHMLNKLTTEFTGIVDVQYTDNQPVSITLKPGILAGGKLRAFDSVLLEKLAESLPPFDQLTPAVWESVITPDRVNSLLNNEVAAFYLQAFPGSSGGIILVAAADSPTTTNGMNAQTTAFEHQLQYESSVAGLVLRLIQQKNYAALAEIFYTTRDTVERAQELIKRVTAKDGGDAFLDIEHLNPRDREHLKSVVLSPISVVHLFRQYFFELDTFLGTPVSHVWLSPGSSVELVEIHTRRTMVERTLETNLDVLTKSEITTTQQDEISEAVKEDRQQDIKLGASVKASYASIEATSSFDYAVSQQTAREITHKQMREQTEKLSSEIRKNFKSTFKTVTDFTDVSSTKHTMANTTDRLINYELRRKMRQVGVQVQDIGTFLCWQTYVDDPGRALGLAKLIHLAKPAELDALPHPEEIPLLQPFQEEKMITIPFISIEGTGADNEDEVYVDGVEADDSEWFGSLEKIQSDFVQEFVSPKANYQISNVEFDPQGKPVSVSRKGPIMNSGDKVSFVLHLDSADFQGQNSIQLKLVLHWSPKPGANDEIVAKNKENLAQFKEAERAAYEKAYLETVKERVTLASQIKTRNSDELREEERIVVYRKLIQDMLLNGVELPDDRTRHVAAELLNSIFDIDKMLYFVAPEWWRPRLHRSRQQLQETSNPASNLSAVSNPATSPALRKGLMKRMNAANANLAPGLTSANTVGWGGINDAERDNYFITEDSEPARLGSSLGWLLQLDGDNLRNAFLNAPWVKAVIPIRPGKEAAAINWLKGVEGLNGITDDVIYRTDNPNEKDVNGRPLNNQKMIDVLMDLAEKVRRKYNEGIKTGKYPKREEISDPALVDEENTVTATPIDRVYEHGFFPLAGSFRANVGKNYEIFDQWVEILPTDQIVPVEVKYDPKTGRQV
ncbi:MAG TPA: peptidoglycan-binding protein [Blastocatellia bacterium]|nr:peptidoglycan-binding protein [Blastocatellia bacterium]